MAINRQCFNILSVMAMLLWSEPAGADDAAVEKYRNYLPEQIQALPEATRHSELPMMYSQAASTGLSAWARDLFAMQLNTLMYSGIGDYESAVRAFQRDLGDKPTGNLTVWQIFQLNYRSEMQKMSPPSLSHAFLFGKTAEFAYVNGTMTILDDRAAWPINYAKLTCDKAESYCRIVEMDVQPPTDKDWVYDFNIFWTDVLFYKITRWSEDVIQAEYEPVGDACRATTLDLNFRTKEFYLITKNTGNDCEILGEKMDTLKKPRISQIVDGEKIIAAEHQAFKQKAYDMLSSEFRTQIEKYQQKSTPE
jgi:hypothetical protein